MTSSHYWSSRCGLAFQSRSSSICSVSMPRLLRPRKAKCNVLQPRAPPGCLSTRHRVRISRRSHKQVSLRCPRAVALLIGSPRLPHRTHGDTITKPHGNHTQLIQRSGQGIGRLAPPKSRSRYRKPTPTPPTPAAPVKRRLEREEQITPPSRAGKDSPCPTAAIKPAVGPPKPEVREVDAGTQSQEGGDREHEPPPRPGAHPKKCPVQ